MQINSIKTIEKNMEIENETNEDRSRDRNYSWILEWAFIIGNLWIKWF